MSESGTLVLLLKRALKAKGITYKDLANELDMSEAGVKRFFSHNSLSLERFAQICQIAETSIEQLAAGIGSERSQQVHQYSLEQEKLFVKDPVCFAIFDSLLNGKSVSQILRVSRLSRAKVQRSLGQLDSIGLIQWLPKDKVKLMVTSVKWRENGPLRRAFYQMAKTEFLNHSFNDKNEFFQFQLLQLSRKSQADLNAEIKELMRKYSERSQSEKKLGIKVDSTGLLGATRGWNFSVLAGT